MSKKTIHTFTDSHGEIFTHLHHENLLKETILISHVVYAATVTGLRNPNSITQARKTFLKAIDHTPKRDYLLFMLGEVDCGVTIWNHARKHRIPIARQMKASLSNYFDFIMALKHRGYQNIIVASAPLPIIKDDQTCGGVAYMRQLTAPLAKRTALTLQFNKKIKAFCERNQLIYMDMDCVTLDPKTGMAADQLRRDDLCDVHFDPIKVAPFFCEQLQALGFQ